MASTYTTNIGIEKPGTGEQSGNWGTTTNTNFDIIDRAINGVGDVAALGGSQNLTTTNGTLSPGGYKVLNITGTPGTATTFNIQDPDMAKVYLVYNGSDADAIFSQGSGTNATVPASNHAWIYADGGGSTANVTLVTVQAAQIADGSITSAKILDGTIATADLADSSVTSAKIVDDTIVNADINSSAAVAFSKMAALTADRALTSDSSGVVSASSVTSTELGYVSGVTSSIQTQLNSLSVFPNNIVFKTSGSGTIALPAGTQAALVIAAGGGGGGGTRGPGGGNTSYNGSPGGDTTVTLASPSISVTAKGGLNGNGDGSYNGPFSTGDAGGAVFTGMGGAGGAQDGNFDITGNDGRRGNMVKTYVKDSGLGGKSLSYSVGAGGASSGVDDAQAGANGFVEVWYW